MASAPSNGAPTASHVPEPANLSPEAFRGTAAAYLRHRLPYPATLLEDLLARVRGRERLLDLACGPGRLALPLARSFRDVWAVDLEPEMIAAGEAEASRRGIANIRWQTGRAEALAASAASFDLIVIGEAFHRLDQRRVAALSSRWLKHGGCIAVIGGGDMLYGNAPWHRVVLECVRTWTRDVFPQGWAPSGPKAGTGVVHDERVLRDAGFCDVASFEFTAPHVWSIESIVGYLRSTSVASARILGGKAADFDAALAAALLAHDPSGAYAEQIRFGYTLGRAP
jgi:SAM-dependent methyltransferase